MPTRTTVRPVSLVAGCCLALAAAALLQGQVQAPQPRPRPARTDAFGAPLPPGAVARLGSAHLVHGDGLTALSPDNRTLAVAEYGDKRSFRLSLWDTRSGRERLEVGRFHGHVFSVAFSPDGKLLAAAQGGRVAFWNPATGRPAGKPLRRVVRRAGRPSPRRESIHALAFSPDGRRVATAAWAAKSARVRIWDSASRIPLRSFAVRGREISDITFTPGGKRLAVTSTYAEHRYAVTLRDAATGRQLLERLPEESASRLSPDGRLFTDVVHNHSGIVVREVASGRKLPVIPWQSGSFALSRDGKRVVTSTAPALGVWDTETGRLGPRFGNQFASFAHPLYFSADDRLLVSEESDYGCYRRTRIWDVATGRPYGPTAAHQGVINCLAFAPDGSRIATGGSDETIRIWDAATGEQRRALEGLRNAPTALAFGPDGKTLAAALTGECVRQWDVAFGRPLGSLKALDRIDWLGYSADGKTLRAGTSSGSVLVWVVGMDKEPRRLDPPWEDVADVLLAPDGKTVVTCLQRVSLGDDDLPPPGAIRFWDSGLGRERVPLNPGPGAAPLFQCGALALSPDGKVLATSEYRYEGGLNKDHALRLWETATGRPILRWPLRWGSLGSRRLAFSPDGRLLATAHHDQHQHLPRVCVWDTATGKELACFGGHTSLVTALAFAPDGSRLATASRDTTALVWDVAGLRRDPPAAPLTADELRTHWGSLTGDDAAAAWRTIHRLIASPKQTVPFLRARLRPASPVDAKKLRRWIADLGHAQFALRHKATVALQALGEQPEGLLRQALRTTPSLEHRRRIEALLTRIERYAPAPDRLRALRALTVLERIGSAEARDLLRTLAAGAPEARLTDEARQALRRLSGR